MDLWEEDRKVKVLVIGLDGGTWQVLDRLMAEGYMPNLAGIVARGAKRVLSSTIPPVTAPAWASFQTGKNPGKHGLYEFTRYQRGSYETPLVNASDVRARTLWQTLSERGKHVGVVSVPVTYPPAQVNGFLLSGVLTPSTKSAFTWPPELAGEITANVGKYKIFVHTGAYDYLGFAGYVKELADVARRRKDTTLYLMNTRPWDFLMVHFQDIDALQHVLWSHVDPSHPRYETTSPEDRQRVAAFYRTIDGFIGEITGAAGEALVMVVSDHGCGCLSRRLYINEWLRRQGLLETKLAAWRLRFHGAVIGLAKALDVFKLRRRLKRTGSRTDRFLRKLDQEFLIDFARSRAYAVLGLDCARIYVNLAGREKEGVVQPGAEYDAMCDFLAEQLSRLRDPATGAAVVSRVYRGKQLYHGPFVNEAPDILAMPGEGYVFAANFKGTTLVEDMPGMYTGSHRVDGIFAACGPHVRAGVVFDPAEIVDVAPTVLHAMGQDVPADMDGRVMLELFDDEFARARRVRYRSEEPTGASEAAGVYDDQEEELVRQRLKDLGYLA